MLMPKSRPKGSVRFDSGVLIGLEVERGKTIKKNHGHPIDFGDEVVGYKRFYTAQQIGIDLSETVSVPFDACLEKGMYVEAVRYRNGSPVIYKIEQLQRRPDTAPASLLLSLSELKVTLLDERDENEKVMSL